MDLALQAKILKPFREKPSEGRQKQRFLLILRIIVATSEICEKWSAKAVLGRSLQIKCLEYYHSSSAGTQGGS